ncbi:MAG TPA: copper resistance protein CopC [Candidatus Limnocylindrales bacterium]|nr:copper resistance protein CopC [Candidatus Limnocylindrales bacterium]
MTGPAARWLRILAAALVLLAAVGPLASRTDGHAELLAGSPAAGEVLAESPAAIRLVFSEPIEKGFSTIDVIAADGTAVVTAAGEPDPLDEHALVASMPPLDDGSYTVVWRVLSKVDGHADVGSFVFAVASPGTSVGPRPTTPVGPTPRTGHQQGLETQGRILLYAGLLVAFGLVIAAWVVLEPAIGRIAPVVGRAIGIGLLAAGIGAILMLLASGLGLSGPTGRPDLVGYATASRPGILLVSRIVIGLVGGIIVLLLVRRDRMEAAIDVAALAATAGIAITVASGHAAVFEPPVTIAVWFVHAAAAGVWLAGLAVVAVMASRRPVDPVVVRAVVIRYSALALVAIALVVLTGGYQEWVEVGGLPSLDEPYGRVLIAKTVVAALAFTLGLLNYLDGGRLLGWLGGLGRRVTVEAFLAAIVIVITASLVATSPPGPGRPVELADVGAVGGTPPFALAVSPGRPGPSRFSAIARTDAPPDTLQLHDSAGALTAEVPFRSAQEPAGQAIPVADVADVGVGAWRATVLAAGGSPVADFPFVMEAGGVTEGRAVQGVDPGLLIALAMVIIGIGAVVYARAGGTLPRVDRVASKVAMTGGGLAAFVVGLLVVALGPRV